MRSALLVLRQCIDIVDIFAVLLVTFQLDPTMAMLKYSGEMVTIV